MVESDRWKRTPTGQKQAQSSWGGGPGAGGRFAPPEHLARGPRLLDPNNPLG